ncbi:hypothetical protein GOBAR_DD02386 [Gossypium barbadense]|nr:hypothetical protein GOBAR_DD02386 [Gossypium barbadense]
MDIENGYFLAKFQNREDYEKELSQGPWFIYMQYITVQTWTMDFNLIQTYLTVVKAWIRLPGLSGFLYKRRILEEIGGMIGKVAKLDFNTDSRMRGKFVQMAIYVNLDKLLVFQVIINGTIQRVEFEFFPVVCFTCGRYGHMKEVCLRHGLEVSPPETKDMAKETVVSTMTKIQHAEETTAYSPWMIVERRPRRLVAHVELETNEENLGSASPGLERKKLLDNVSSKWPSSNYKLNLVSSSLAKSDAAQESQLEAISTSASPNSMTFSNPIFAGLVGMEVSLQNGVLDPGRHSVISFKVNKDSLDEKPVNKNNSVETMKGIHVGKGHGTRGKVYSNKNGKVLNRTLQGRGKRFKASGNL